MKELYKHSRNRTLKKIVKFINKKPVYREDKDVYTINLRGKARYASVKNMVIVNAENEK